MQLTSFAHLKANTIQEKFLNIQHQYQHIARQIKRASTKHKGRNENWSNMERSAAILFQMSSLKDMLHQVNEKIEATFRQQVGKLKVLWLLKNRSWWELHTDSDPETSLKNLDEKICCLTRRSDEILISIKNIRHEFIASCLPFQNEVSVEYNDDVFIMLANKELLRNEVHSLNKKKALESSTTTFVEEVLEDLQHATSANFLPVNYVSIFYISWYHFYFIFFYILH